MAAALGVLTLGAAVGSAAQGLEEVVISVQKREQSAQDAPALISVLSADVLRAEGISDARALQSLLTGVRLQAENTSTQIFLRGVGSNLDFPQLDPPTSLHLNGVYVPREATSTALFDLAQVEVLPGPQSTLYGRSSLGGTVNANFARPSGDNSGELLLEAGNFDLAHLTVAQNLAASDKLALRVAANYRYSDGFMASGADAADDLATRLSLDYTPGDRWSIYAWTQRAQLDGSPPNLVVKGVDPATGALSPNAWLRSDPWNDRLPAPWSEFLPFGQPQAGNYRAYRNRMSGAEIRYQISDALTLSYLPAYTDFAVSSNYWLAALPANKTDAYTQHIHELRLNGTPRWGEWLAGLYAYRMDSEGYFMFGGFDTVQLPGPSGLPVPVSIVDANRLEGLALFGEAVIDLGQQWQLTVGGRYSEDERRGRGRFLSATGADETAADDAGAVLAPYDAAGDYDRLDFKLSLVRHLGEQLNAYASVQTAYMPGTFNPYASTELASNLVDQAELTGYSAGIKGELPAHALRFQAELYFYDYDGLFGSAYNTVLNATQTFNVDKTEVLGAQLELSWSPSAADHFTLSVSRMRARYVDFELPDGSASFDGFQAQYAPDWSAVLRYQREVPLRQGTLRLGLSSRYESAFFADFRHTPGGRQQAARKSNAQLSWLSPDRHWELGLWVRNIENEAVIAATAGGSNIPPNPDGATAFLEPPRSVGLRLQHRWR